MAAAGGGQAAAVTGLLDRFAAAPYDFEFFQAVRLLQRGFPRRQLVGRRALPADEVVRFRAHQSLGFPASSLSAFAPATPDKPVAELTVTFMGLTGPNGALPLHYTQLILDLYRDLRGAERRALRDWFDLFNHRLISLFYRAWEKYRFSMPFERGESADAKNPDTFTRGALSLVGLGTPALRERLRVAVPAVDDEGLPAEKPLGRLDDLALLHYAGYFARRVRPAHGLAALLSDYFRVPVSVTQFQGQWLPLEQAVQTQLGSMGTLGVDAVAGSRVWDVQGRVRLRVGPLRYDQFEQYLPDRRAAEERKTLFVLSHMARHYLGPEFDFDVELVLQAADVPMCALSDADDGPRLGWNCWLMSGPGTRDVADAVFEGEPLVFVT